MQQALDELWMFTDELFMPAAFELNNNFAVHLSSIKKTCIDKVKAILQEATLAITDENVFMQTGGKQGKHTNYLDALLNEMQFLQRTYPGSEW